MSNPLDRVVKTVKEDWAYHVYYDRAEQPDLLETFWGKDTLFSRAFSQLDRTSMIDLACGHGRHAAQILDTVGFLLLLDVNETNIDFCRKRFEGRTNVQCQTGARRRTAQHHYLPSPVCRLPSNEFAQVWP